MINPGRVVILNGVSSAGKTTIATAFRDQRSSLGDLWMLIGIDDYLAMLPAAWLDLGSPEEAGRYAADGLRFTPASNGKVLEVGGVCRALLRAYQAAVVEAAKCGINVIVDEVVIDTVQWNDWQAILVDLDVTWVGIRCDNDVAEARELARGDRIAGMSRSQQSTVHRDATYDFEIDTTSLAPDQATAQLVRHLGY